MKVASEIKQLLNDLANIVEEKLGVKLVNSNQTAIERAVYPFVSYTLTSIKASDGSWGEYPDGTTRKPCDVVISLTAISSDYFNALDVAERLRDLLDSRNPCFKIIDNETKEVLRSVVVVRCQTVSNRDAFLSNRYEYRFGFDATFSVMRELTPGLVDAPEQIDFEITMED